MISNRIANSKYKRNVKSVTPPYLANKYSNKHAESTSRDIVCKESLENIATDSASKNNDKFVYEEYIARLISSEDGSFRYMYKQLNEVIYTELPRAVEYVVSKLNLICKDKQIYLAHDEMYSFLFNYHKKRLAISLFRNSVTDLNLSNARILEIYSKIGEYDKYNLHRALIETENFAKLVKVLSND